VANFDTGGKYWEHYQYQTTDTQNLKEKIYLYVNSTTERCPNKIIKTFLIEKIFPFATPGNNIGGAP
jgi:hypothetical protein